MKKFQIEIEMILEGPTDTIRCKREASAMFSSILRVLKMDDRFEACVSLVNAAHNAKPSAGSHITFIEISNRLPYLMFQSGYFSAKEKALGYFGEDRHPNNPLPNGIERDQIVIFADFNRMLSSEEFKAFSSKVIYRQIEDYFRPANHIDEFWFRQSAASDIYVVGGPDDERVNGDPNADIYNFGDKDTFIDTCIFLSRHLPKSHLIRTISTDDQIDHENNLVVIGGPGAGDDIGNELCRIVMEKLRSSITYQCGHDKKYFMQVGGTTREAKTRTDKRTAQEVMARDYGYFACAKNPLDPSSRSRVVLINGIHTYGVLGAFLAFSDHESARKNYQTVLEKARLELDDFEGDSGQLEFECFFEVLCNNGRPKVPTVRAEDIYFFNRRNDQPTPDSIERSSGDGWVGIGGSDNKYEKKSRKST